jgi:hypothetical protein
VLGFFSSCPNRDSRITSPAGDCVLLSSGSGAGEGVWGSQFRRGDRHCGTLGRGVYIPQTRSSDRDNFLKTTRRVFAKFEIPVEFEERVDSRKKNLLMPRPRSRSTPRSIDPSVLQQPCSRYLYMHCVHRHGVETLYTDNMHIYVRSSLIANFLRTLFVNKSQS